MGWPILFDLFDSGQKFLHVVNNMNVMFQFQHFGVPRRLGQARFLTGPFGFDIEGAAQRQGNDKVRHAKSVARGFVSARVNVLPTGPLFVAMVYDVLVQFLFQQRRCCFDGPGQPRLHLLELKQGDVAHIFLMNRPQAGQLTR